MAFFFVGQPFRYCGRALAGEGMLDVGKVGADADQPPAVRALQAVAQKVGAGQERFVRLAFANVADDKIPAVLERLERFDR